MSTRTEVLNELVDNWEHCLRCVLSDKRAEHNKKEKLLPNPVPFVTDGKDRGWDPRKLPPRSTLHVLYPCPDPEQSMTGTIGGIEHPRDITASRNHFLLEHSWAEVGNMLPWPISEVTFSVALGCRPVNFKDPKKIRKPSKEWLKACRARWQTELLLVDPELVLICGQHALATVLPDMSTNFSKMLGEVVTFEVPGRYGMVTYCGYVAPSPELVSLNTRDEDMTAASWRFSPQMSRSENPFHDWLWHLCWAAWLAETLRRQSLGIPTTNDTSAWGMLVRSFNQFHQENKYSVIEIVNRIKGEINAELEGPGSRAVIKEEQ